MIPHPAARLRQSLCWCVLCAAVILTCLFLVAEIRRIFSPYQWDYGEGHVLWLTQQILNPDRAYKPVDFLPYVVNPYTPLYMLAARAANLLTGDLLLAGRGLSLVSMLGAAFAVGATVFAAASSHSALLWRAAAAAFTGVLPLLADTVDRWAPLMRVDMLALFLMYAGLYVFMALGRRPAGQYAAAALFSLAILTKQTMLSAPLACVAFSLVADRRAAARLCALMALLLLAGLFAVNAITHGGFFTNVFDYNANPFSWKHAALVIYSHLHASVPWIAGAAAACIAMWNPAAIARLGWLDWLRSRAAARYSRAVMIASLNCAFAAASMIAIGKMGATYNHLIAWDVSTCLLCGLLFYRALAACGSAAACAALLACLLLPSTNIVQGLQRGLIAPVTAPGEDQIVDLIRHAPGPVFSENLTMLIQSGKPVEVEPATVTFLALTRRWDEQPYVSLFQQQYFSLVVAYDIHSGERYTQAVTAAIEKAYVLAARIGAYSIYRPRPPR